MKKKIILEKKKEYLKAVKDLKRLRPPCHFVSAVSTICFVVVWCISREFAKPIIQSNPYIAYSIILSISIPAAFYFEKIVNGVINTFALIFADRHGWKAVAGIGLVLAPIFFVAASTSFVGFKNSITQTSANESIEYLSNVTTSLNQSNDTSLKLRKEKEDKALRQRNQMRKAIENKWSAEIQKAKSDCKRKFKEHRTNNWHKAKLDSCVDANRFQHEVSMNNELLAFDQQTQANLDSLDSKYGNVQNKKLDSDGKVIDLIAQETKSSIDRVNWLGGFFGFGAVLALVVSLLAAVMEKKITNILLDKANNISPTLSKGATSGHIGDNFTYSSSGGGEKRLNVLATKIDQENQKRLAGSSEAAVNMNVLIDEVNELGYGVYFENDEKEFTIKKK